MPYNLRKRKGDKMKNHSSQDKCDLCNKDRKGYQGSVWYSGNYQTDLCKSCWLKWIKSKERRELENRFKKAKPCTKLWHKKCVELQKAFDKWYYARGGKDEKS